MAVADLRVVCGPTAAGKSAIALALAERHGATIISADSRQVYTGFDIGTAKPTPAERARVPHRGIDVADPSVRYSAAAWADAACEWIDEAHAEGRIPLLVGGTGLYLRALAQPLFEEPPLDPDRRDALALELGHMDTAELRRWCERLDPARAHLGRTQLLRAIEIALLSGQRHGDLLRAAARPPRYRLRYLVIDPGATLADRIAHRVDAMFDAGWEDEVRRLMRDVPEEAPAWNACGYGSVRALVRGRTDAVSARADVIIATRQYAKRQRTWFRHQLAGYVLRVSPDALDAAGIIDRWWNSDPGERGA